MGVGGFSLSEKGVSQRVMETQEQRPLVMTYRFKRQWRRLPAQAQEAVGKSLTKLRGGSCRIKPLVTHPGLFEVRVLSGIRMIVEMCGDGLIVRSVGNHGPILRRP